MSNILKKIISTTIVFCLLVQFFAPITYAYINEDNILRGGNAFIEYLVDKSDGRFIIRTVEGVPYKTSDNNKKLIFERDNDPETSFTTFRVDGTDYIFGNTYLNKSGRASDYINSSNGLLTKSKWVLDGLEITQTLEVIEDPEHPNLGNVKVKYDVTNKSKSSKNVGSRILLDTQTGNNDGASFNVGGQSITTETILTGGDIPDFYRSSDNEIAPTVIGYGFIKGFGNIAPNKVVFAHFNTLSSDKWNVDIDTDLNFTTDNNVYQGADSAVAYYFNEKPLGVGETRTYETFYGLGDFSHFNSNSPYQVSVITPEKLTVNDTKSGYEEEEITITVIIDNTLEAAENLTNVNISLVKRDFVFADVSNQEYSVHIPVIEKDKVITCNFKVAPVNQDKYLSEPIRVSVISDNNENPVSSYDYVLLPSINGELPSLTLETISPKTVYHKGYREFNFTGNGFLMLNNRALWELYLVDSSGSEIIIPDNCITIDSDEKITVFFDDDTITQTPPGKYGFKIYHDEIGNISTPEAKAVTFSDDIKFKSRKYGVLYIEKTENNKYLIKTPNSVDELQTIKEDPNVIFDIVGDVIEKKDENNNTYYIVKADSTKALINSVIEYHSDKPIKIEKKNDLITIEGDGTLQIAGNSEFWWWNFYTYISDGVNYITDRIVEEEDNEDELEENEDESEEGINLVIDFFNPLNAIGAVANTIYDGFNLEIKNVILLGEGASFGGELEVEIPYGAEVPCEEEEISDEEMDELLGEALVDLFLTDEERAKKYADNKKTEKNQARIKASIKIRGLLFNDDAIYDKITELIESSSETPVAKARIVMDLVLKSPELITTVYSAIKGKADDDDGDRKSVGVKIDVKKVLFGKKYNDFFYDSVRYIGLDAEGEIKVTLPFGTKEDREGDDMQGIRAAASINTIEGEYSFEAEVNLELCEASAIVSIVRVDNELKPDHIELTAGYDPGVPIATPIFINKVGGGVDNLVNKSEKEPLTIVMILGLNLEPTMEGEFRAEASKHGFSLEGSFEFSNGLEILKQAKVELQWVRPIYFKASAKVELFEIIEGSASLFIGEKKLENNTYKFFFEGKASVAISIPEGVFFVGGKELTGATLGLNTEKIWGSIKVINFDVGVTYLYGKEVSFSAKFADSEVIDYESLTKLLAEEDGVYQQELGDKEENGSLVIGSNIKKVGASNIVFANNDSGIGESTIVSNQNNTSYDIVMNGLDNALIEIKYQGDTPNLTVKDPNGNDYALTLNENYLTREISADYTLSRELEKYIYISINKPLDGTWTMNSDLSLEYVSLYEGKSMPRLTALDFSKTENQLDITFAAENTDDALVTLFLVNANEENSAGYALESNVSADTKNITLTIPRNLPEGEYKLRATIQHPSYGFNEIVSDKTIYVIDENKPQNVTGIVVENIGDGLLKATFNELTEEGTIDYYVTVYDENYQVIEGYSNIKTSSNSIIFGGSYSNTVSNGSIKSYQMPYSKNYRIGVTPVKTLNIGDEQSIHIGDEAFSNIFEKRAPNPPSISITYQNQYITENDKKYFGSKQLDMKFSSNQFVNTDIYVDKEYYLSFKNTREFSLPLQLADGEHIVEFICKNNYNDTTKEFISLVTDTTKPELFIDSPSVSEVIQGAQVQVIGSVESGAEVYINDVPVSVDNNGYFTQTYNLDENKMKQKITIKAQDLVGNETIYESEVINSSIKPINKIRISEIKDPLFTGTKTALDVKGIDEFNKEIVLDNTDIEFSIIKGDSLASINEYGELVLYDKGSITILASYSLTNDYQLQDAIDVEVETGIASIQLVPEISKIEVGKSISLSVVGATKYSEVELNDNVITYSIVKGSNIAKLEENVLTAMRTGEVTIKAIYHDKNKTLATQLSLKIVPRREKEDYSNIGDKLGLTEAKEIINIDKILTGVWQNLLERESNLEIVSAREIDADNPTIITLTDIGRLEIPESTIINNDVFLSGIMRKPDQLIDNSQYNLVGDVYELTFKNQGGKLQEPIKLTLLLNESHGEDIAIYVYNEIFSKWQYLGGDVDGNKISTNLNHLSNYAVLEDVNSDKFMDISGVWSEKYIKSLASIGLIAGEYSGGYRYYAPKRNLSRLELAAFVLRVYEKINNIETAGIELENIFADYHQIPDWGKEVAKKAYQYGLIKGDSIDGKTYFNPHALATRAETITVISRAIGVQESVNQEFIDSKDIPTWAKSHINHLVSLGLLGGYADGTIRANNNINRAEIAKIIYYWVDHEVISQKEQE